MIELLNFIKEDIENKIIVLFLLIFLFTIIDVATRNLKLINITYLSKVDKPNKGDSNE